MARGSGTRTQETLEKIERERKAKFLRLYAVNGNLTTSARLTPVARSTVWLWTEMDEAFSQAYHRAKSEHLEVVEAEIYRRAVRGVIKPIYQGGKLVGRVREFLDILLIFYAKALGPEKYRDRFDANLHGDGALASVIVHGLIPHPDEVKP